MSHRGQLHRVLARGRWCGGMGMMVVECGGWYGGMVLGDTVGGDYVRLCVCEGDGVVAMPWGMMM